MIFTSLFQCVPLNTIDRPCSPAMTTADQSTLAVILQLPVSSPCHPSSIQLYSEDESHSYALMMTQSERLLQESHDCPKANDFFFLSEKRRSMELMTSQHGRTTRSQTDLYQCYHCYKCWLKTCSSNGHQTVHTPLRELTPGARSSLYVLFKEAICLYIDSVFNFSVIPHPETHPNPTSQSQLYSFSTASIYSLIVFFMV